MLKPRDGIERLAESCVLFKRMWTETGPFDLDGRQLRLRGVPCEPKPVKQPHPPILIGAFGERRTLRVVAEHADLWNMPGRRAAYDQIDMRVRRTDGVGDARPHRTQRRDGRGHERDADCGRDRRACPRGAVHPLTGGPAVGVGQ